MQQEILEVLEAAAAERSLGQLPSAIRLVKVKTSGKSSWKREDIYDDESR
jgi:hypothetical protein